jgi:hypothetical protein
MLKWLRIAVTALSLTACVLLIALWVRSYWWFDMWHGYISNTRVATVGSIHGRAGIRIETVNPKLNSHAIGFRSWPSTMIGYSKNKVITVWTDDQFAVAMPYGLVVLLFAAVAPIPWIKRRFALRTLLIATTLVAVALGVAVAAM